MSVRGRRRAASATARHAEYYSPGSSTRFRPSGRSRHAVAAIDQDLDNLLARSTRVRRSIEPTAPWRPPGGRGCSGSFRLHACAVDADGDPADTAAADPLARAEAAYDRRSMRARFADAGRAHEDAEAGWR
jgi:hypothetical protein